MLKNIILLFSYETSRMCGFIILIIIGGLTLIFPPVREFLKLFIRTDDGDEE